MMVKSKTLLALFILGMALVTAAWFKDVENTAGSTRLAACEALPQNDSYQAPNYVGDYSSLPVYEQEGGVAHSPTIIEHLDGSLQAVWFFGEDEAEPETGLASSMFVDGSWSEPRTLLTAESETKERGLFVNTIGNPLLVRASTEEVWLFYVTVWLLSLQLGQNLWDVLLDPLGVLAATILSLAHLAAYMGHPIKYWGLRMSSRP